MIHSPQSSPIRNITCNNMGKIIPDHISKTSVEKRAINIDKAYIIHFKYKSTEEFINKYKRGYRNWFGNNFLKKRIKEYLNINKVTLEKIEYLERSLNLNLINYKKHIINSKKNFIEL